MAITNQNQVSFHEATILSASRHSDRVSLSLDDVLIGSVRVTTHTTIQNVSAVLRDGLAVESVGMEEEDGEILGLFQQEGQVVLVVQWNKFSDNTQSTVTYKLVGGEMAFHVS